ncbi:hypothetical protein J7S95_18115 [Providencia stuartii]|uniref:Uncharacterized protein n=1 Tax=Providencia stuartii (strain MRSN 2154) TaxID=1157951 RepID=A0A140NRA1_PROSM|nr:MULTISPECIES: hypothetical protein [Providencia]AFH95207.1 hypothetical protein S70_16975 [Providencia stuartii MRSN 2154]MBG5896836.1 hypothetical protein [Providencia stuartii]MBQ0458616.1 hypothetical protein [Providencia stuartii]MTC80291.1 hypothetical protein [Providencia stuartii]
MLILNKEQKIERTKWIEPAEGLKLLVGSANDSRYQSVSATAYRHIERLDSKMKVGTSDFDISKVDTSQPLDELLMFTVAQYLLKDWQGVGELNAKGEQVAIEYTPERGARLLKQCPDIYWKVIDAAVELSKEESEQIDETIKKS